MKKEINISRALKGFFGLPDWQNRVVVFGGFSIGLAVLSIVLYFLILIPILGIIIFCAGILIIFLVSILGNLYFEGYRIEYVDALIAKKDVSKVGILENYSERIMLGLKLAVANFVYYLPVLVLGACLYLFAFLPVIVGIVNSAGSQTSVSARANASALVSAFMGFYLIMFVIWGYQMLLTYVVFPVVFVRFRKTRSVSTAISLRGIGSFLKHNWMNMFIATILMFGASFVFGFAFMISFYMIFLCVGLILFPVVMAFGTTYIFHLQADLYAQLEEVSA